MPSGDIRASRRGVMQAKGMVNQFNTTIPPKRKKEFDAWVQQMDMQRKKEGRGSILLDKYDYDIQGAFLEGAGPDNKGHFTDKYKKPNHPTFSTESIYHGPQTGYYGGTWEGEKFIPKKEKGK